jgi:glycosyltransferase involved in cell wall biosynthesis
MTPIDITVITPTISGREALLEECTKSVQSQTMVPTKHLVGLDKKFEGPAAVRNRLLEEVETEWVSFLDDDDLLMPNHFEVHSLCMDGGRDSNWHAMDMANTKETTGLPIGEHARKYDIVSSWAIRVDIRGNEVLLNSAARYEEMARGVNFLPVTCTVRTELLRSVGGFNVDSRFEDLDLWKRLFEANATFGIVRIPTWYYREQSNSRNSKE